LTTQLFGFAQLDFAGAVAVADGRYVVRDGAGERVLVLETLGAPPPARRRRRARSAEVGAEPQPLPLARATVVRASEPFAGEPQASRWLEETTAADERIDRAIEEAVAVLNRALHAHAAASGDPHPQAFSPQHAVVARLGYGSGEEVAGGGFTAACEVDPKAGASRRRQRTEELRPQERVAALLGGRERLDACETLILRARADLDAGRQREAALQLRVGLEALLVELRGALDDPGHEEDMATLEARRQEAGEAANAALQGDLDTQHLTSVQELVELCERVLRRRRVLRG
jgi:hypothetical protein